MQIKKKKKTTIYSFDEEHKVKVFINTALKLTNKEHLCALLCSTPNQEVLMKVLFEGSFHAKNVYMASSYNSTALFFCVFKILNSFKQHFFYLLGPPLFSLTISYIPVCFHKHLPPFRFCSWLQPFLPRVKGCKEFWEITAPFGRSMPSASRCVKRACVRDMALSAVQLIEVNLNHPLLSGVPTPISKASF